MGMAWRKLGCSAGGCIDSCCRFLESRVCFRVLLYNRMGGGMIFTAEGAESAERGRSALLH